MLCQLLKPRIEICVLLFAMWTVGCKTTEKADLSRFNQSAEARYPAIAVVMTSEDLQYYNARTAVMDALKEAQAFESIQVSNPYADFAMELHLDLEETSMENNVEGFTKAVVFGSTLGAVPIHLEYVTSGTVKLRYHGVVFDEFPVGCEFSCNASILNIDSKDVGISGIYRKTVEQILETIEARKSFEQIFKESEDTESKPVALYFDFKIRA